ncbi:MAG: hypothetical protein GX616_27855 [Planctomycetes bacterium]|nr:hypothetical protein [Planctomycetota bacterium]
MTLSTNIATHAKAKCPRSSLGIRFPKWENRLVLLLAISLAGGVVGCEKSGIAGRKPEKIIGGHGFGPGEFPRPRAIAVAPDGCVFIIDMTARIQRFNPDGEFEAVWRTPESENGKPTGITVDAQGRVLVADSHYHRVIIYDRDGRELARFGEAGTGPGSFDLVAKAVVDREGVVYVGEYGGTSRISRFSPEFKFIGAFGGSDSGPAALSRPQSMVFDKDGTLWVADSCNHRICQFSREGKLLSSFGGPGREPGQLQYPYGLAFCEDGTLLVIEFGNSRLQRFDRTGKSLETWGGPGTQPGQMLDAWGVAVGKEGRVYVVDCRNHRVQMFRM